MSEMNKFDSTDWLIYNASTSVFKKSHFSLFLSQRNLITVSEMTYNVSIGTLNTTFS